jgi:hypothetical protein
MNFLQHRLRTLQDVPALTELENDVWARGRTLADELLHTRQTEPLGETLQRRLAMAERICRDLAPQGKPLPSNPSQAQNAPRSRANDQGHLSDACWIAEIERLALSDMLQQWWGWLHRP